ncbi:hypothetical protein ACH5RR_037560 [Cinchona calisaya]|uniref:Uncharacterized protein n=1 Tax=Cinchona calisaya TaxID=153742 RepID=A0ABD2Y8T5_9GENT
MAGMVRVNILDVNEHGSQIYLNLFSFLRVTDFRVWAEIQVYGQFRATEYLEATHYNTLCYVYNMDNNRFGRTVLNHCDEAVPGSHWIDAEMRAKIEWIATRGASRRFQFQEEQWQFIQEQAYEIFIAPGNHQPLVVPLIPGGP